MDREPTAHPLTYPSGAPTTGLAWADVEARLTADEDYLLSTVGPDGAPHVRPVLAVWLDGALHFNTGRPARKARDLAANDRCAVTLPASDVDLVLEGTARLVRDAATLQRVADGFGAKYPWWHPVIRDGDFYDPADEALADPRLVYAVVPTTVFAFGKEHGFSATRWHF